MQPSLPRDQRAARPRRRPGARAEGHSRGQSLVEFALVLPVLLLLVLMALDFGRVFLGWVVLNNAARIGAQYASLHPQAWGSPGNSGQQAEYQGQIQAAMNAVTANCDTGGTGAIDPPSFVDQDGDGASTGLGDNVVVSISCDFQPLTPLIADVVGTVVTVGAESVYPIKNGPVAGPAITPPPPGPLADFTATTATTGTAPLSVSFQDASTGSPITWLWDFGDGFGSAAQNPSHTYTTPGTYDVRLTVSNANGTSVLTKTGYITVAPASSGSPGPSPSVSPPPSTAPCTVPGFIGTKKNNAQATWSGAGFTTTLTFNPNQNGNWTIQGQSLVGGSSVPCNSGITLSPNAIP
jgi:PKD repeat protein